MSVASRFCRVAAVAAVAAIALLTIQARPTAAAGGGGCHQPPSHGTGTTVRMVRACMTPTVLRADAGSVVTFVNDDDMPHNVVSSSVYEDLPRRDDSVEIRFSEPGVYPYSCTIHPGMNGAIVVGDGVGATDAAVVVAAPPESLDPTLVSAVGVAQDDRQAGSRGVPVPVAALTAVTVAGVAGLMGRASARRPART
jgi:plastocyanin